VDNKVDLVERINAIETNIKDYVKIATDSWKGIDRVKIKGDKGDKGDAGKDGINGKDGKDGIDGKVIKGLDGKDGKSGKDGKDGLNGVDGINGKNGRDGKDGEDGKDGSPDTGEEIVSKINSQDTLIQKDKIEGLAEIEQLAKKKGNSYSGVLGIKDITAGSGITIDKTNNQYPIITASGGSGSGDVVGPASAVDSNFAAFDTTTGKLIKDSGSKAADFATASQGAKADAAVVANVAITGATKTKVTYDAKGLVTSGADATTADIADSADKRYCTDAQKTVIGNTSGTNTGDNATNSQYSGLAASKADVGQTFYIGTTQVAINRTSAALTLAGLTLTTPNIGTPSAGTLTSCTGLPIAGLTASTSTALGVGSVELGHATDTTIARVSAGVISVEGVTVPTISSTNTLTNKRITPRVLSATSYTTDTGTSLNIDNYDQFIVTAQAGALKFNNPSGTPTDGQKLIIAVTGTAARALTYDTQFEASTVALPSTTVTTARLNMGFLWRADTSKWVIVASA
jgi:hypothetical protein